MNSTRKNGIYERGFLLVLVLIFGGIFFLMITTFMGFAITQHEAQRGEANGERALAIAEAGLNYYKWFLAHNPNDIQNGTGEAGPYVMEYRDPEGDVMGEFSLGIEGSTACGDVTSIEITSTGSTTEDPQNERTIYARYARPTVAEYAYIINSNVWAGPDRTIVGPYHSNGVIRMDGENNSIVSSGQESFECDNDILNCDPPHDEGDTVDAVFGEGEGSDFWIFPAPPINFTGITVDLANMATKAQASGIFIEDSGAYGYRVSFENDGTIDVYVVDEVHSYTASNSEQGSHTEENVIKDDDFFATYEIPDGCALIYIEDKVWLEGTVSGKATLVAAEVGIGSANPSIILNDDIVYAEEGSGLLAVAEQDVLVGLVVPDDMEVNGIFIAQNGRVGRNHYTSSGVYICTQRVWWFCVEGSGMLQPYVKRDSLTINGTIVSNGSVGTKWTSGGVYMSGFETRYNSYDRDLVIDPPPLTPNTSSTYEFIEWREME